MEEARGELIEGRAPWPFSRTYVCPIELVLAVWPAVHDWIAAALATNRQHLLTSGELREQCARGDCVLLLMRDEADQIAAAAVIRGDVAPDGHAFVALMACGGRAMDDWLPDLVGAVKAIAAGGGASEVVILGRPGWRRALAPFGFEEASTLLACNVDRIIARGMH